MTLVDKNENSILKAFSEYAITASFIALIIFIIDELVINNIYFQNKFNIKKLNIGYKYLIIFIISYIFIFVMLHILYILFGSGISLLTAVGQRYKKYF